MFQICLRNFLWLKKLKTPFCGYVISDLKIEEIVGMFSKKELQNTSQKEFRVEKGRKRNGHKLYVKWKGYDSSLDSWDGINSETFLEKKSLGGRVKVELHFSNYKDLKMA